MPTWTQLAKEFDPLKQKRFQIIDDQGKVIAKKYAPEIDPKTLIKFYRDMLRARIGDTKMTALQRQGRMGTFASSEGQEGAQAGSIMALVKTKDPQKNDWVFPAFREFPAALMRDVPMLNLFQYWAGFEHGALSPPESSIMPPSIPVGSQPTHAVGYAYALKLEKKKNVTLVYFGDGATSEGECNEALNFANVFKTPTIFLCQNNQYAISTPVSKQCAAKTLAQRAIGFGFYGIQVDGNDVLAMYVATKAAREHCLKNGPAFIEAFTYRLGNHTTADNPKIYRSDKEVEAWRKKDPILRFRLYLQNQKIWSEKEETKLQEEVKAEIEQVTKELLATQTQKPEEIFNYMFKELTWPLKDQQRYLKQFYP